MKTATGTRSYYSDDLDLYFDIGIESTTVNEAIAVVTARNQDDGNGRSQWIWIEMPDGSRFFGCEVQGELSTRIFVEGLEG